MLSGEQWLCPCRSEWPRFGRASVTQLKCCGKGGVGPREGLSPGDPPSGDSKLQVLRSLRACPDAFIHMQRQTPRWVPFCRGNQLEML